MIKSNTINPLVSICCITYNHENYIREAIEGFLIQKTNFHFEILIHDDASIDKTAEIVREYEKLYPQLIRGIYQTENQFSKGIKISPTFVWPKARGKYIALCEGDDYWTDPDKLQKQADFLEANPEYGMVYANVTFVDEQNKLIPPSDYHKTRQNKIIDGYVFYDYLKGTFSIMTNTVLFRKDLIVQLELIDLKKWYIYDIWIYQRIMMNSKINKFEEIMGSYRNVHDSITKKGFTIEKKDFVLFDNLYFFKKIREKEKYPQKDIILLKFILILLIKSKIGITNKIKLVLLLFYFLPYPSEFVKLLKSKN